MEQVSMTIITDTAQYYGFDNMLIYHSCDMEVRFREVLPEKAANKS